jgi:hypothetical protein
MSLDRGPNPYDFSTPAKPEHFAGRTSELETIARFAASVASGRPTHLLLHGRRGVGKTSLLGKLEMELEKRGVRSATISLNDSSSEQSAFFREASLAIATAIVRSGGLDGPDGQFARAQQEALVGGAGELSEGPLRVVRYLAHPSGGVPVPDSLVLSDLEELVDAARETDSPGVVLIVDEADRLASQPTTVQRIRSLLLTPSHVSTVFCGTDELLESFDTAFAPIGRHFTRLRIDALADVSETRECLARPLRAAGLNDAVLIPADLPREIHGVSGGRPFEIVLLGYEMFEDKSRRSAGSLALSETVLEAVANHVRPAREDADALSVIRELDAEALRLAARHCVDPRLSLTEHAMLRLAFGEVTPARLQLAQAEVQAELETLERIGLGSLVGLRFVPSMGEWGRMYLKYRSRVQSGAEDVVEGSYSDRLAAGFETAIVNALPRGTSINIFSRSHFALSGGTDEELSANLRSLRNGDLESESVGPLPLAIAPSDLTSDSSPNVVMSLVPFEINEDGFAILMAVAGLDGSATRAEDIHAAIESVSSAAGPFGLSTGLIESCVLTVQDWQYWHLSEKFRMGKSVVAQLWMEGRPDIAIRIGRQLQSENKDDLEGIESAPGSALAFLNNIGFVELAAGHLVEALTLFERAAVRGALREDRDLIERAVLMCNLAACHAGLGQHVEALRWTTAVAELPEDSDLDAGVLIVFTPDPDWAKAPVVVRQPSARSIALGSRASVLAVMGDQTAVAIAKGLVSEVPERWSIELLQSVANQFDDTNAMAEARELLDDILDDGEGT